MGPKAVYYKVLQYQVENLRLLHELFDVTVIEAPSDVTTSILAETEVMFLPLGYLWDKKMFQKCPKLKVVGSNTTGHGHINITDAEQFGVEVVTLKEEKEFLSTITPTAEHTFGLILALTRNLIPAVYSVKGGKWDRRPYGGPKMLSKMDLGVVGFGRLGQMVGRIGLSFGMKVSFHDPYVEGEKLDRRNSEIEKIESLFGLVSESDIISVHVPHVVETENMFNDRVFSQFRNGSYFINTSRGELVDHNSLLRSLQTGRLAGAAVDVFEGEFDKDFFIERHPLWQYFCENDNLLVTPHIGGSTIDAWRLTEEFTIKEIKRKFEKMSSR